MSQAPKTILGQSELDNLRWEITGQQAFKKLPRSRSISYRFQFEIWNHYDYPLKVKVQVVSPSEVLVFRKTTSKTAGSVKLKSVRNRLVHTIEKSIPRQKNMQYAFSAYFRPHYARPLQPSLVLQYRIFARNEEKNFTLNSDPNQFKIPVEKRKRQTKTQK
jgi:hypothetical protein